MQQDNPSDFKERLNTMKIIEFRQKKEEDIVNKIFKGWKSIIDNGSKRHYNISLYCKVFKGLMMSRIQLDTFADKLQNVYINMLLKNHFDAFKQFKLIRQEQSQDKINQVKNNRIKLFSKILINNMKRMMFQKREKEFKKYQIIYQIQGKYKTDQQFYRPSFRETQLIRQPTIFTQNNYSRQLGDSRKSAVSSSSMVSDLNGKRKFATVKMLPKMPILQSVIQQQNPSSENLIKQQEKRKIIFQENQKEISRQQKQQFFEQHFSDPIQTKIIKKEQISKKQQSISYNKQKILSFICQLKMLQIHQFTSIIDQYSSSLKYQSIITEKNYLSQSISTLNNIITS